MNGKIETNFMITQYGVLVMKRKMCVPNVDDLRKDIMEEANWSTYAMHLNSTKMYRTIQKNYWWLGMKRYITKLVSHLDPEVEHVTIATCP